MFRLVPLATVSRDRLPLTDRGRRGAHRDGGRGPIRVRRRGTEEGAVVEDEAEPVPDAGRLQPGRRAGREVTAEGVVAEAHDLMDVRLDVVVVVPGAERVPDLVREAAEAGGRRRADRRVAEERHLAARRRGEERLEPFSRPLPAPPPFFALRECPCVASAPLQSANWKF